MAGNFLLQSVFGCVWWMSIDAKNCTKIVPRLCQLNEQCFWCGWNERLYRWHIICERLRTVFLIFSHNSALFLISFCINGRVISTEFIEMKIEIPQMKKLLIVILAFSYNIDSWCLVGEGREILCNLLDMRTQRSDSIGKCKKCSFLLNCLLSILWNRTYAHLI